MMINLNDIGKTGQGGGLVLEGVVGRRKVGMQFK